MPRTPKPWFRKQNATWYIRKDGKQIPLGKDKAEAHRKFHELMSGKPEPVTNSHESAYELACKFLVWCRKHRAERTTDGYKEHLVKFFDHVGKNMPIDRLKPYHVIDYMDSMDCGDSYKRQAVSYTHLTLPTKA